MGWGWLIPAALSVLVAVTANRLEGDDPREIQHILQVRLLAIGLILFFWLVYLVVLLLGDALC